MNGRISKSGLRPCMEGMTKESSKMIERFKTEFHIASATVRRNVRGFTFMFVCHSCKGIRKLDSFKERYGISCVNESNHQIHQKI
jgi:hypothetical protein